eukprot:Blabericola_migrator_1__13434@NODE_964_length_5885_cov_13_393090_g669_i0_p3_GENE_NODE_964_length_5885_cov_13_393090_g669_i0NODE_964_length_5885_cov_13_393090_g669_i0_p3_ORF_typecomplete_len223_score29_64Retrotrans_gag/PF03732_17/0_17Retrotrans_gag/PF03732_17/6_5e02_NODE_964_length_5885_cov_13_393090_g669_i0125793
MSRRGSVGASEDGSVRSVAIHSLQDEKVIRREKQRDRDIKRAFDLIKIEGRWKPRNEEEFEEKLEDWELQLQTRNVDQETLRDVLFLLAPFEVRRKLKDPREEGVSYEEFITKIVKYWFPHSCYFAQLQQQLSLEPVTDPIGEYLTSFEGRVERLKRLCARHDAPFCWTDQEKINVMMRKLPGRLKQKLIEEPDLMRYTWDQFCERLHFWADVREVRTAISC